MCSHPFITHIVTIEDDDDFDVEDDEYFDDAELQYEDDLMHLLERHKADMMPIQNLCSALLEQLMVSDQIFRQCSCFPCKMTETPLLTPT